MCGIFGYVTANQRVTETIQLSAGLHALRHRGPDAQGTWEGVANGLQCGLAHARLAILDLSPAGHQPMRSSSGRYQIVFNGEIFNHEDLRRELEALGHAFRSHTDTEVILEAWERWGADALQRLRGMFAFALLDTRDGRLIVARDRVGVKPLYFAEIAGGVAFASEIRALLASGAVARKVDRRALAGYLAMGSVPEPLTMIEGIRALPPGCILDVRKGQVAMQRYWSVPVIASKPFSSFDDAAMELRAELRDAVRIRLISDVPLGIFLSGGIDSSALVALAAEVSHSPLKTFTVSLDDTRLDEAKWAADIALRFGCEHNVMRLSAESARRQIDRAVAALDQPSHDGINTYFVAQAARQAGITVALSGLGGDELFAGYPAFRYIERLKRTLGALQQVSSWFGETTALERLAAPVSSRLRKGAALLSTRNERATYGILRGLFTPEQSERILGYPARLDHFVDAPEGFDEAVASGRVDPINAHGVLEISNYMRNTLLRDADVMSMAHALEVRVPLVDHKVLELAARVPGAMKLSPEMNKPLLVAAVPTLPRAAFARRKQGFALPFDSWFRGSMKDWMEERLLGSELVRHGMLDANAVESMWRDFLRGERFVTHSRVWSLAVLVDWCQRVGVTA